MVASLCSCSTAVPKSNESESAFRISARDVAFMLTSGATARPPSRPIWITLAWAMCRICSPHVRWAGVGRKPNLSSGMAFAILTSVSRCDVQSLRALSCTETVWAAAPALSVAHMARAESRCLMAGSSTTPAAFGGLSMR